MPTLAIGSDHAGFDLKTHLIEVLRAEGHRVLDLGCPTRDPVDYPGPAEAVARAVVAGTAARGILICGTGIGMSIAANKVAGARAALVHDPFTAEMARRHNDANVLCLGGRLLAPAYAAHLVACWLGASFEARHQARLDQIAAIRPAGPGSSS